MVGDMMKSWYSPLVMSVGVMLAALGLNGCGVARSAGTGGSAPTIEMPVHVASSRQQIGVPAWVNSAGVTQESIGSATGYILDAMHNAVIWQQGTWRFQVVGPFVVLRDIEFGRVQDAFHNVTLPGTGVVSLTETHHLWNVAVSWQDASVRTIWDARFAISESNTDAIRAVVRQITRGNEIQPGTWACRATLRAVENETAISDAMQCRPPNA